MTDHITFTPGKPTTNKLSKLGGADKDNTKRGLRGADYLLQDSDEEEEPDEELVLGN